MIVPPSVSLPSFSLSFAFDRATIVAWHIRCIASFICCLFVCSCSTQIYDAHIPNKLSICQIWQVGHVIRDDNYGNIFAFFIVPGSNNIVEVSHVNAHTDKNDSKHGTFDSLLIELPNEGCLTNSPSDYMPAKILYSAFTGRYAVCIDTNSTPKAIISVISCTEQNAMLDIDCSIPCIWYNPLHPESNETATFEKHIYVKAMFNVVNKDALCYPQSPIVTFCGISDEY